MANKSLSDRIGHFVGIPKSFVRDRRLSSDARTVFLFLRYHSNDQREDDAAFPKYRTLEEESGLHCRRVAKALRELEETGWVTRTRQFGRPTRYEIVFPSDLSIRANGGSNDGANGGSNAPYITKKDLTQTVGRASSFDPERSAAIAKRPGGKKSPRKKSPQPEAPATTTILETDRIEVDWPPIIAMFLRRRLAVPREDILDAGEKWKRKRVETQKSMVDVQADLRSFLDAYADNHWVKVYRPKSGIEYMGGWQPESFWSGQYDTKQWEQDYAELLEDEA